jgi:uncharacterized protein
MGRSFRLEHRLLTIALGFWLAACGLDSNVSVPSAPASPANGGATLTGASDAGTENDAAATEFGDTPVTVTVDGGQNGEASEGGAPGGIDSGGAPSRSTGGIGGAAPIGGGTAGAGGSHAAGSGGTGGRSNAGSSGAGNGGAGAAPPTLFFSEYVEGSSSNKALEITAVHRSTLDGCKIGAYFNGSGEASVVASLSGVLEAGQVLTLCTSTLSSQLGAVCNQVGRLTFNGNDALALACDGKIFDVIGQIGVDPGTAWGSGTTTTLDHTLRRKCSVTAGDASGLNAFDPSAEWQSLPIDTFSGLGSRGC